jgi:hypothetical protein
VENIAAAKAFPELHGQPLAHKLTTFAPYSARFSAGKSSLMRFPICQ